MQILCNRIFNEETIYLFNTFPARCLLMERARAEAIREGGLQEVVSGQDAKAT
jgi:hypothetical protein